MRPPRLARALVRWMSDADDREFILDDLDDRFHELAGSKGSGAARRWYWSQALRALPAALLPDVAPFRSRSWQGIRGDIRFALRTLRRSPFYAFGVAGTLGLGLAAATISLAVSWNVWLKPLPIPDSDRVVRLYEIAPPDPDASVSENDIESRRQFLSEALAADFNEHQWETIEGVSRVVGGGVAGADISLDGATHQLSGVTLNTPGFEILGMVPILGRLPTAVEQEVVISERFWRGSLASDPDIIGKELVGLGGVEIVGVVRMPDGYPREAQLGWFFDWRVQGPRTERFLEVIARVRPEYLVSEAEAEMNAFLAGLSGSHPEHAGWEIQAVPLREDLVGPFRGVILLLLASGAAFLLIATVNVMGLVAARRVEGRPDRSIRLALGASEGRLLRASLLEGLLVAATGGAVGVASAYALASPVRDLVPQDVPRLAEVAVGPGLATGGLAVALTLGVAIGLLGYVVSRGVRPSAAPTPSWSAVGTGGRRALLVGQVALTTLLAASGVATLHRVATLQATDLGFAADEVSVTSGAAEGGWDQLVSVMERLEARGVESAFAFNIPMDGGWAARAVGLDRVPLFTMRPDAASADVFYQLHLTSPGYFAVMGIELLAGRDFLASDDASSQAVTVVSEDFVEAYFGSAISPDEAVGRSIQAPELLRGGPDARIVGVARSTRHRGPDTPTAPDVYIHFPQQTTVFFGSLLLDGDPEQVGGPVREVLNELTPGGIWSPLRPYAAYISDWYRPFRFQLLMVGVLAGVGLLLATLGLYSFMAYQVASARREIGVRKAVGAPDRSLIFGVIRRGVVTGAVGAAIGLLLWYRILPIANDFVEGIDGAGLVVPIAVAGVIGGTCLIATIGPALRAARVDPVVTLKTD